MHKCLSLSDLYLIGSLIDWSILCWGNSSLEFQTRIQKEFRPIHELSCNFENESGQTQNSQNDNCKEDVAALLLSMKKSNYKPV